MGTYNYAPSTTVGGLKHAYYDVAPYYLWGNTADSKQKGVIDIEKGRIQAQKQYEKNKAAVDKYRQNLLKNEYIDEIK